MASKEELVDDYRRGHDEWNEIPITLEKAEELLLGELEGTAKHYRKRIVETSEQIRELLEQRDRNGQTLDELESKLEILTG